MIGDGLRLAVMVIEVKLKMKAGYEHSRSCLGGHWA